MLAENIPLFDIRRQDTKNRQNSIDDVDAFTKQELEIVIQRHFQSAMSIYKQMLDLGIAKECAHGASSRHAHKNLHVGISAVGSTI